MFVCTTRIAEILFAKFSISMNGKLCNYFTASECICYSVDMQEMGYFAQVKCICFPIRVALLATMYYNCVANWVHFVSLLCFLLLPNFQ